MRTSTAIYIVAGFAILAVVAVALMPQPMPTSPLAESGKPAPNAREEAEELPAEPTPVAREEPMKEPVKQVAIKDPPAPTPPAPTLEPVRRDIRNVTPDHALPGPILTEDEIVRLPAIEPPPVPPKPPEPERWQRALVIAPGILKSGDREIVIAGVEPLASDAVCGDENWPCGNFAKPALRRLIRQRAIDCDPVDDNQRTDGRVVTRCEVAGRDIGEWLVAQGWARPLETGNQDDALTKALEEARASGRGQWRGQIQTSLPAGGLPQVDLTEVRRESGNLLAPGLTAAEALASPPDTEPLPDSFTGALPDTLLAPPTGSGEATAQTQSRPSTGFPLAE